MIINVDIPYDFYDTVYLKTDIEQKPYMVTAVKNTADGGVQVELQSATLNYIAYLGENSSEKNVMVL